MNFTKHLIFTVAILLSSTSFALTSGKIQKNLEGEVIGVTQPMAADLCAKQALKLPTMKQLESILADPKNTAELRDADYWGVDKGVILFGGYGWISDFYNWPGLTAGVICI